MDSNWRQRHSSQPLGQRPDELDDSGLAPLLRVQLMSSITLPVLNVLGPRGQAAGRHYCASLRRVDGHGHLNHTARYVHKMSG